jgi:DNA-directed RNA polymerase specialized sigma24 family protein
VDFDLERFRGETVVKARTAGGIGSAEWARCRLCSGALANDERSSADDELIQWLYSVARRRALAAGVRSADCAEVVQDAMPRIVHLLTRRREGLARADNPAAFLERVAARSVSAAVHRLRMAGMGGVSPNGRNWRVQYPKIVAGEAASALMDATTAHRSDEASVEVETLARKISEWVSAQLHVRLTADAIDAVVYIMDRLVAGTSRAALVRGGNVALAGDPAMGHLGFSPSTASGFARWLLGRSDPGHEAPSVLDAVLADDAPATDVIAQWARVAVDTGAAVSMADGARPVRTVPAVGLPRTA